MTSPGERGFLTAEWRNLLMLNYEVPPSLLLPYVPHGTELDARDGTHYASIVGFLFVDTPVRGCAIPWHRTFEEVNLRFSVRRAVSGEWRRGVVFIREIVPRTAIAVVARVMYGERYIRLPMAHLIDTTVRYLWRVGANENFIEAVAMSTPHAILQGSEEDFIAEHFRGYASTWRGTVEYRVTHPPWSIRSVDNPVLVCDAAELYGPAFSGILADTPASVFLVVGSSVCVYAGERL